MAQAVVFQVPNLTQGVVDNSAGTFTYQTYDTSSSSWVTQWTLNIATGDITTAQSLTVSKALAVDGTSTVLVTKITAATKSVTGTTAGSFTWVMPQQGSAAKEVLIYFDGYENDTTTAQTITFPTAFTDTPEVTGISVTGLTVDTTQVSIKPDVTTKFTGFVKVWGF